MTDDKALPIDTDDYSLPGRVLDSNSYYTPKPKPKSRALWMGIVIFVIFSAGFYSFYFLNQTEIDSQIIQNRIPDPEQRFAEKYNVGAYGSEHSHAAIVVAINGVQINFGHPQYQLNSKYIHFENHNPYLIHKHATGAPLEMLFASFGMKITQECIIMDYQGEEINRFCSDDYQLMFFINGEKVSEISQYEIKHNDRILITLSDEDAIEEQLEYLESLKIFEIPKKTPQYSGNDISI